MLLCWLPYISFTDGVHGTNEIVVGNTTLWPDSDDTWQQLGYARPDWMNMARDFPRYNSHEVGPPLRGTVIVGNDDQWLRFYAQELIAVLYFLGDRAMSQRLPIAGVPAEAFRYHIVEHKGEQGRLLTMWTKKGAFIEDPQQVKYTPSSELRGHRDRYKLDLMREESRTLVSLLDADPNDRLVTAVRHYFEAQFADIFTSPWERDYASYCASLEAAFDIDPFGGDVHRRLYNLLKDVYTDDARFRQWVTGLYSARSVQAHGVSPQADPTDSHHKIEAYRTFIVRRGNASVCRVLCRDILLLRLLDRAGKQRSPYGDSESGIKVLNMAMYSDERWAEVRRIATKEGSIDAIVSANEDKTSELQELARRFDDHFDWGFMDGVAENQVIKTLIVYSAVLERISVDDDDAEYVNRIKSAIKDRNQTELAVLHDETDEWEYARVDGLAGTIKTIVHRILAFWA